MNENDFYYLFDASKNVINHAEKNEIRAKEAIRALTVAVNALDQKTHKIKCQIELDINNSIESAANEIVDIVTKKFKEAEQLAEKAAVRYKNAVRWTNWQFVGALILVNFICLLGIVLYLKLIAPY